MVPTPQELAHVPREQIPDLLVELERVKAILWMRLWTDAFAVRNSLPAPAEESRMLTAKEAARLLGVGERWLYRNAPRLPFAKKLSFKTLRFDEAGLRRWRAAKQT